MHLVYTAVYCVYIWCIQLPGVHFMLTISCVYICCVYICCLYICCVCTSAMYTSVVCTSGVYSCLMYIWCKHLHVYSSGSHSLSFGHLMYAAVRRTRAVHSCPVRRCRKEVSGVHLPYPAVWCTRSCLVYAHLSGVDVAV